MERRGFLGGTVAAGIGLAVGLRALLARAKGLPSDPDGPGGEGGPEEIILPGFEKNLNVLLEQALLERRSSRNFAPGQSLSREELSRLLWALTGVNRTDGHRTTPSALARYPVDVYAALPEGVYEYQPDKHRLIRIKEGDMRGEIPIQPNFKQAGMIVLYVVNQSRFALDENPWADVEIGCMVQNLHLEAAALGLGSCVFALVRYENATKEMGLKKNQVLRLAQAVGRTE